LRWRLGTAGREFEPIRVIETLLWLNCVVLTFLHISPATNE
jgi:hypothetical protein